MFIKKNNIDEGKYIKLYQKHFRNSIGAKLVCIDNRFTFQLLFLKVKIVSIILLNRFLHSKKELIK